MNVYELNVINARKAHDRAASRGDVRMVEHWMKRLAQFEAYAVGMQARERGACPRCAFICAGGSLSASNFGHACTGFGS